MVVALLGQLTLNGLEQIAIEDWRLLACESLASVDDLADIEPVTEQISEGTSRERDTAHRSSVREPAGLGDNSAASELLQEPPNAADFEVGAEYRTNALSHIVDDDNVLVPDL